MASFFPRGAKTTFNQPCFHNHTIACSLLENDLQVSDVASGTLVFMEQGTTRKSSGE